MLFCSVLCFVKPWGLFPLCCIHPFQQEVLSVRNRALKACEMDVRAGDLGKNLPLIEDILSQLEGVLKCGSFTSDERRSRLIKFCEVGAGKRGVADLVHNELSGAAGDVTMRRITRAFSVLHSVPGYGQQQPLQQCSNRLLGLLPLPSSAQACLRRLPRQLGLPLGRPLQLRG